MRIVRRSLLTAGAGLAAAVAAPAMAAPASGLKPDAPGDQSVAFARAVTAAAKAGRALALEPGLYRLGAVALPAGARIEGVPGATRLVAAAAGPVFTAAGGTIALVGLGLDGEGAALDQDQGLVAAQATTVTIRDCSFAHTGGMAVRLERCGGVVEACRFDAVETAVYANDSAGLTIAGNHIIGCANNGILVHRSQKGYDGTLVLHNRIEAVRADSGGLGWNGNGINVFRAGHVQVAHNVLRDCAFSFIRANSADAVQILGNSCLNAGETGIYSEFSFEGAIIAQNVVERAANGISVANFDKGGRIAVVQGNIVRGAFRRILPEGGRESFGRGICIEADSSACGNVVEGCAFAAFSLGYGNFLRDVALTGNVARQCGIGVEITIAEAARNVLISGNVFSGCPGGAVVGYRWEDKASADLAGAGAEAVDGIVIAGNTSR